MVVSDNAANMVKAGKLLGCHLHLGCFAHTLNIAVQKALKVDGVASILTRIRRMVSFIHRSNTAAALLKAKAELLRKNANTLKTDVATRWNSAFDMIQRYLQLQEAVTAVIRSKELSGLRERDVRSLDDDEVVAAEQLVCFLKPLKDMTVYMCSEAMPTASTIMPLVESLLGASGHLISREEDSAAVAEMKRIMAADLKERYSEQKELLHRTTALDPRFKSFPYMSASQRDEIFRQLIEATVSLHQTQSEVKQEPGHGTDVKEEPGVPTLPDLPAVADTIQVEDVEEIGAEAPETQTQPKCLLDSLLTDVFITHEEPPKGPYQLCSTEVASYRQEAELSMKENPLEWWKVNAFRYPMLARMAKMYLSTPATSVPSERVFSTAGDIVTAQRASLKAKHVDKLIFLKKNM